MTLDRDHAQSLLTEKQFRVWDLHVRGGLSINATARTLRVTPTTVRSHLYAIWLRIQRDQEETAA